MIGIVCGMVSEARCVARTPAAEHFQVRVSGASALRAAAGAAELADTGVSALISFGLSGALDPACAPGRLLLPAATVLPNGGTVATDPELLRVLLTRAAVRRAELGGTAPLQAVIAGSDGVVGSGEDKAALRRATGAVAVDMESHAVARVARERGLAYAAIRAIADPAQRAIPPTAIAGLARDGTARPLRVVRALMARPQDLPALIRLGRDASAGLATLRGAALHLLPAL